MASYEEKVEEYYKKQLDSFGIKHFTKTENINKSIDEALKNYDSKSGGKGINYPDIKVIVESKHKRIIPVMIEAKGSKNKLIKIDKNNEIDMSKNSVMNFAINGAIHYANAILELTEYQEVIAVGINGYLDDNKKENMEFEVWYLSKKNNCFPKKIEKYKDFSFIKSGNIDSLIDTLDKLTLTEDELEEIILKNEVTLETRIHTIHQSIYDDLKLKTALSTNEKLYLFCGLIMAGLPLDNTRTLEVEDLKSDESSSLNDGQIILGHIRNFLEKKSCTNDKKEMIVTLLQTVFQKDVLIRPYNGESKLKDLYKQIKESIIPCLTTNLHLDFAGKILNKLSDWIQIDNDIKNDVVLTPRYVTKLMAKLARTDKDSFVWDSAMGSAGFLVSAMDLMIKDAQDKIIDKDELDKKIKNIKEHQLLGIEILGNIYILAVLNMILMGDGSSNIINGDSFNYNSDFPANVFLLNPPYSAEGKGFNFVERALSKMTKGYGCILIQENAGSGQGLPYTKNILKNNTLVASIKMSDIFCGKAGVQTAIYLFKVNRPHEEDDIVTFIDFSNDGYSRQNRKKSSSEVNLKDTDDAKGRYKEIEAIILGKKKETNYYSEENGLVIRDTISLNGDDWAYSQHKKIDTVPTEEDFRKTVADYLAWKVSQVIKEE